MLCELVIWKMMQLFHVDLNEIPLEEVTEEERSLIEEEVDTNVLDLEKSFVGQCFLSEEEAFIFYKNYARINGFSVRKGRFDNKSGKKNRRDFVCHREGHPRVKLVDYSKKQRNRGSTRCDCKAHMRIKLRRINEIFPEEWQVTTFVMDHTHDLLSTREVRFLPSYRNITTEDKNRILLLKEPGLSVRQIMRVMELEKNIFSVLMKKSPQTILTDQDRWMTRAIVKEMPSTKHAFCIWHITSKFSSWFMSVLRSEYSNWCSDFYTLYKLDTVEEFEQQWPLVTTKYNLTNNKHVLGLYQIKTFWVPAYLREFFLGGMTTTGRSESINAFVKRFLSSRTSLTQFIRQVDLAIEDVEQKQLHDTMLEKYRGSNLRSVSPLEEQAHRFFTPFAFKKFQEQFGNAIQYLVPENDGSKFIVKHHKATRCHTVFWDGKVAMCTCKNFEFVGILCRHILCVFIHVGCFEIPSIYLHPRWSRNDIENDGACSSHQRSSLVDSDSYKDGELVFDEIDLVQCPIKSKTKGRPQQKRKKSGKELTKQARRCGRCKGFGHNITTCKETNIQLENNSSEVSTKRNKIDSENEELNPILSTKC
ncbi:protein FAR1-RELATED SEQUENCE 11-like [Rutidosis leptorrhynchoides]|uniref:protein FAR1-RELATED SEQUENCE 11-like n=1 Tax=Rutidosis leptorrhynchoides TaxID=125765 RepID=UPI003A9A5A45